MGLSSGKRSAAVLSGLVLLLTGCREEEIRVYTVPKEKQKAVARSQTIHWHWTLPAGWTEKPADGMRAGSFAVSGSGGRDADVSIIPLAGGSGTELENVNRWRRQVGLADVDAQRLGPLGETITIGETNAALYDFEGTDPQTQAPTRLLAASLPRGDTTWFFKMTGPVELVAKEKDAFKQLLKSIHFGDHSESSAVASAQNSPLPASPPPTASPAQPSWDVPAGWTPQAPSPMLLGRFLVAKTERMTTEATVSAFPGSVGGLLDNINRWRGQIGLGPVGEPEAKALTSTLDVNGEPATLVDITNTSPAKDAKADRVMVVMLSRNGQMWFFKLIGENQVVEREKTAFIQFVRSVRYPNA